MGTVPGLAHTCEVRAAVISGVTILVMYLPLTALNHALGFFAPRHLSTVALLLRFGKANSEDGVGEIGPSS